MENSGNLQLLREISITFTAERGILHKAIVVVANSQLVVSVWSKYKSNMELHKIANDG